MVFHMKEFDIGMSEDVFKVGTDATLLGALSPLLMSGRYLDIGTGTGIIALMLAQRNKQCTIDAIDSNPIAAELAGANFENSPYKERLRSMATDLSEYIPVNKYTHIFSNPPYYQAGTPSKSQTIDAAKSARHMVQETILDFCVKYLEKGGRLSMVYPTYYGETFQNKAANCGFQLVERVHIRNSEKHPVKRWVDTYEFIDETRTPSTREVILYKKDRAFTDEARSFLKPFLTMK